MKNKLKQFREELGLTQEQLGELVGVSRQAINAIETGKFEPSIWLAYDIAKVFHDTIEEVFLFEESERKSRSEKSRGVV
ncbi:transcriptional regulator [Clostridium botulinum]|uniref:helix-turn-helix transcriptional regulator n=1 Tax=Clostridium botulinum TaxID=1491 RepID=UPI0005F8EAC6|nr:helix-turn-helix transcriptional regulator [Clostridium botulinum]APQ75690.1 helix-turn-helix family protein [Clostridium botulinum]AUM99654.1 transcriptional regulator [Clostridium botulinum]AUN18271.1 transcriptional regulator [Clostridium botulinum]KEI81511.1 DNA-binding protein [Clostridium botulinum B2 331]KOM97970.1 DNA-binding protein [Clostridium botulinum]